jgi:hypothetical protein
MLYELFRQLAGLHSSPSSTIGELLPIDNLSVWLQEDCNEMSESDHRYERQLCVIPHLPGGCQDKFSAVLPRKRFFGKMVECEPELMSIGITFHVQLVAYVFQANYVVKHDLVGLTELENRKRIYSKTVIFLERQDLYCDVRQFGELC